MASLQLMPLKFVAILHNEINVLKLFNNCSIHIEVLKKIFLKIRLIKDLRTNNVSNNFPHFANKRFDTLTLNVVTKFCK